MKKNLIANEENMDVDEKNHSTLTISKSLLEQYRDKQGVKILLRFHKPFAGDVKLHFYGFSANNDIVVDELLPKVSGSQKKLGNIFFGDITQASDGKSLHELLTESDVLLSDWTLTPIRYDDRDERYVSYELMSGRKFIARLNPSPPY